MLMVRLLLYSIISVTCFFSTSGSTSDGHFTSYVRLFPSHGLSQWHYSMTIFKDGIAVYKEVKKPLLDFFSRLSPSEYVAREKQYHSNVSQLDMSNEKDYLNIRCAVFCIIRYTFQGILITDEFINHSWYPRSAYSSLEERACELAIGQDDIEISGLLDSQTPVDWLDVFKELIARYSATP